MSGPGEEDFFDLSGRETDDELPWTKMHDWSMFVTMPFQAHALYRMLRSMMSDDPKRPERQTRKITDGLLCKMLGAVSGTEPSIKSLQRWRTELVKAGLVEVVDHYEEPDGQQGRPPIASRRYVVVRKPPAGVRIHRSPWDLIRDIENGTYQPVTPDDISGTDLSAKSEGTGFQDRSVPKTRVSGTDLSVKPRVSAGQTGRRGSFKNPKDFKNPLPPREAPSRLAARKGRGGRRKEENRTKDFSHTHLDLVKGLVLELPGGVDAVQAEGITRLVCAALDRGWAPSAVIDRLRERCDLERSKVPGAVHLHNARKLGDPSRAQSANAALELCGVCDEHGFTDDGSACSGDPEAAAGLCLHGGADPWDDPEYRAEREAEHAETLYVLQKAQERAQRDKSRRERLRAQEAAQRAGEKARRREEAREFLETAGSIGDELADEVRRVLLEADDPAALENLEDLVSFGIGMVESGSSLAELTEVVRTVPREDWRTAFLDRSAPVVT